MPNHDLAIKRAMELLVQVNDGLNEIKAILAERESNAAAESSWGLAVPTKETVAPVTVPDEWVREWITMCNGHDDFVVRELKRAIQWAKDNPHKGKTVRGVRSYLGRWVLREWERREPGPQASGSLVGRGRKHPRQGN